MKYRMQIHQARLVTVEVEAQDFEEAVAKGIQAGIADTAVAYRASYAPDSMTQFGEPWAYTSGWYDLHRPGGTIVVDRATGNVFSKGDIELLRARLAEIGLTVVDEWNGMGCAQVSFECQGRKDNRPMGLRDRAFLVAPREA